MSFFNFWNPPIFDTSPIFDPFGVKEIGERAKDGIKALDKLSEAHKYFAETFKEIVTYLFPDLKEKGGLLPALSGFTGTVVSQVRIATATVGTGLIVTNHVADGVKKSTLIDKIDKKYKQNLQLTFDQIDEARAKFKSDIKEVLGEVDISLEKRIDQISSTVKETISEIYLEVKLNALFISLH
ncbi:MULTISPECIES: hypothetical protein [Nostoc]|uniref:Uncharacterized protein n=1 Tax=Nostoc paludosum FACHB-159 TaxID=2692908 RepID=A0ABR8KD06_9NOSO|nr:MULTISPECIES: hypothetical protein [Nostoc]MBD2679677.1 hypothetical protein [Nostoc sp. FACHB-857]MBD2736666.1 hypothetical protein [Nostoc paludosum FACHB-159]